jgi:selenide,water dikinase
VETFGAILAGGAAVFAEAAIPVAGGHSIDSVEPIYGLVALGLVHPDQVLTNRGARPGDRLILTKGLGVGVFSAALKAGRLDEAGYAAMIASTTRLNDLGAALAGRVGVHAVTDVTGFGLLGHALEMARGANATVELMGHPPLLAGVEALAAEGVRTGASGRNWDSYGAEVDLPTDLAPWRRDLLTDPQTSGGLLISASAEAAEGVLELAREGGFGDAAVIGKVVAGLARVRVAA